MEQERCDGALGSGRRIRVGIGRKVGEIEIAPTAGVVDPQRVVGRVDLEALDVTEGVAEASGELGQGGLVDVGEGDVERGVGQCVAAADVASVEGAVGAEGQRVDGRIDRLLGVL